MIICLKDDISIDYIKKNSHILWAKMFEDHSDPSYKKNAYLESKIYDLTLYIIYSVLYQILVYLKYLTYLFLNSYSY